MSGDINFLGGLLLGFASSLHCAGLRGGIASSLLLGMPAGGTAADRAGVLLAQQIGRAGTYTLMGALVGSVSAGFSGLLVMAGLQPLVRLASAVILLWSGLAIAGLVPGFLYLDRFAPRLSLVSIMQRAPARSMGRGRGAPVIAGMLWGLAPCGMVYGALLNTMFTGSALSGSLFMAGFGLATIPPVALTAFGVSTLARTRARGAGSAHVRRAVGTALSILAVLSLLEPAMAITTLCR